MNFEAFPGGTLDQRAQSANTSIFRPRRGGFFLIAGLAVFAATVAYGSDILNKRAAAPNSAPPFLSFPSFDALSGAEPFRLEFSPAAATPELAQILELAQHAKFEEAK